jgi:hypothetical protein
MANNLVSIMVEVEKAAFIDVMTVLNNTAGVAKINWDLSLLKGRRANAARETGNPHYPKSAAQPQPVRTKRRLKQSGEDMQQHILIAMRDGTIVDKQTLMKAVKRAGFTGASLNPNLRDLIEKHLVQRIERGQYQLQPQALEHLNNHAGALPAPVQQEIEVDAAPSETPPKKSNPKIKSKSGLKSHEIVLAFMQTQDRAVGRKEIMAVLKEAGLSEFGVDALLHKLRKDKLSKFGPSSGTDELTAKGKTLEVATAA